jgi:hypothetical protein
VLLIRTVDDNDLKKIKSKINKKSIFKIPRTKCSTTFNLSQNSSTISTNQVSRSGMQYPKIQQSNEVRFASFLSGGFTTMAVINPPERKLAKCTSVCSLLYFWQYTVDICR